MNLEKTSERVTKLLKLLPMESEREIHFGSNSWLDIWFADKKHNIVDNEGSSIRICEVCFMRDRSLEPDEIKLFCSRKLIRVFRNWTELDNIDFS